jgi:3-oxoacyl-[acyl-carrier-protein] synthase-1
MAVQPLAVLQTGLVTSVGQSTLAACAAIRAGVTNPTETAFVNALGERILGHGVELDQALRGVTKLARMVAVAVTECLDGIARSEWAQIPLLLCVAEADRPGRFSRLDEDLLPALERELGLRFSAGSGVVAHGRIGVALALQRARRLVTEDRHARVLIAAADSLLVGPSLASYEREDRLLTTQNSNGFMPGEAAGALLVGPPTGGDEFLCLGFGVGREAAHINSGEPLRGDGLQSAVKGALAEAGCKLHDLEYRVTDVSGEQYYFKEAALALNRTLRQRKEAFDLWHPAECTGEVGAAAGATCMAVARMAALKAYAPGPGVLLHFGNDSGSRAAIVGRGN